MTTQFKPENVVILLIDFQVGTSQLIKTQSPALTVKNGVILAKAAKIFGIPLVITTSVEEQIQGPVSPELQEVAPEAFKNRIKRKGIVNAWQDENFRNAVLATQRKQIVMAGVTTDICLVYPAISAVQDGFEVQAVMDASGSPFEMSEALAQRRMAAAGVTLTATNTLLAELAQDWSSPTSQQLMPILFGMLPTIKKAG